MSALRLVHTRPRHALSYACTKCGALDSDGMSGPGYLEDHGGGYGARAAWLCAACARVVWGAYKRAVRLRLDLIEASRVLGYPARREDLAKAGTYGVQLVLL
jgi:hypothetical protein